MHSNYKERNALSVSRTYYFTVSILTLCRRFPGSCIYFSRYWNLLLFPFIHSKCAFTTRLALKVFKQRIFVFKYAGFINTSFFSTNENLIHLNFTKHESCLITITCFYTPSVIPCINVIFICSINFYLLNILIQMIYVTFILILFWI